MANLVARLRSKRLDIVERPECCTKLGCNALVQSAVQVAVGVIDQQTLDNVHLGQWHATVVDRLKHANGLAFVTLDEFQHLHLGQGGQPLHQQRLPPLLDEPLHPQSDVLIRIPQPGLASRGGFRVLLGQHRLEKILVFPKHLEFVAGQRVLDVRAVHQRTKTLFFQVFNQGIENHG